MIKINDGSAHNLHMLSDHRCGCSDGAFLGQRYRQCDAA